MFWHRLKRGDKTLPYDVWQVIIAWWRRNVFMSRRVGEQVEMRRRSAPLCCIRNGHCKHCGCAVPDKFYANKGCECYPKIVGKQWDTFSLGDYVVIDGKTWVIKDDRFLCIK